MFSQGRRRSGHLGRVSKLTLLFMLRMSLTALDLGDKSLRKTRKVGDVALQVDVWYTVSYCTLI